jgi:beta-glucanase (GH16 family)
MIFFALSLLLPIARGQISFCDNDSFVLEWADEFEGDELDETKWSKVCEDDPSCIPPFPTHSETDNGAECRSAVCTASAVTVKNGALILTTERDPSNSSLWTTGSVKTKGKAEWTTDDGTYRMCISAKLPGGGDSAGAGQGVWPAHWMMPSDDPCDPDEGM